MDYLVSRSQFSAASAYIVIDRNRFFVNKLTPAILNRSGLNFTQWLTGAEMGRFSGNFGRPESRAAKMVQKNGRFSLETMSSKYHFLRSGFAWIKFGHNVWIGLVINPFGKKLRNFSITGHLPQNRLFVTCYMMLYKHEENRDAEGVDGVGGASHSPVD